MKTNITMASNIFIRADDDIRRDPKFVEQVTGRSALRTLKNQYDGACGGVRLLKWQQQMYKEDNSCLRARNGEMTHGLVRKGDGIKVWEGRCEYTDCPDFATCQEKAGFTRAAADAGPAIAQDTAPLTFEWLGNIDELFAADTEPALSTDETAPPEAVMEDVNTFAARDEYEKIDSPIRIIEDAVESKILVNAAPGSGKTYTAIRRIEYMVSNRLVGNCSSVLVLVYTNAAKNEILSRLDSGVLDGTLPCSARNVDVCTFDSLATSYLDTIGAQFAHLDYNGRIKLFNEKFVTENFSNFDYVIVDELQDLVNERAKMALNILGALRRGYLLLGDKCQAIYDYDCRNGDNITSVEFYKRLGNLLPADVKKYELTGNRRQADNLAAISDNFRHALLEFAPNDANDIIANELEKIQIQGNITQCNFHNITNPTAILCRSNGEAEYISHILHKNGVEHSLLRGVSQPPSPHRFIADCLWDYRADSRITKAVFVERYCARVKDDEEIASEAFSALSEAAHGDAMDFIEIEKLAMALAAPSVNLSAPLLSKGNTLLTVSTIHKAKGREFDTVFLVDSGFDRGQNHTEEARVWYVGCTRAKNSLYKLTKTARILKRSNIYSHRWVQLKHHKVRWKKQPLTHCKNVVLGLPFDFAEEGFVEGDYANALKTQEYIASEVRVGDSVEVVLDDGKYQARHKECVVGCLSEDMLNQLRDIARESIPSSNAPPHLSPVYVANIVTITPRSLPDGVSAYFRESKFLLGIEFTGFPEIDWHYSGDAKKPAAQIPLAQL